MRYATKAVAALTVIATTALLYNLLSAMPGPVRDYMMVAVTWSVLLGAALRSLLASRYPT